MIILLRAWHEENKEMVFFDNRKASRDPYIASHILRLMADHSKYLMMWTGLFDKHGVKVYEGDIIKCEMDFDKDYLPHKGEIVYENNFGAFSTKNDSGHTLFHNHLISTFSVLGNIHEGES